jgi:hypothetical protein
MFGAQDPVPARLSPITVSIFQCFPAKREIQAEIPGENMASDQPVPLSLGGFAAAVRCSAWLGLVRLIGHP